MFKANTLALKNPKQTISWLDNEIKKIETLKNQVLYKTIQ